MAQSPSVGGCSILSRSSLHNLICNLRKYLKEDPALMLKVVLKQGYFTVSENNVFQQ